MSAPLRIWVTRTQPGANATAARLTAMGCAPVVQPVLKARPIPDAALDLAGVDALAPSLSSTPNHLIKPHSLPYTIPRCIHSPPTKSPHFP